ncbi:hypothetical protein [Traorella massiliensis]|uniref:hypothetical protein n=1 Tax=Traorella massiliensis TaxID=1903263 RepID=UPI0008F7EE94|nr:hypothetical protein [Traorella massiliensis]
MKLKKWGALLLALCMIVMMFPTTVMANGDSLAGPDAEKKVIENDLIVQLPSSLDDMIGTSAGNGGWLAVAAEPTWEDGSILDYVVSTQEFYDSTGKKLTAADTFQNNSRYTMKMTFQSFESYHGDYYYVLSGKNNVYVQYMNGTGEREPMKVTVNKDENGNPVITATYSFSIGTPPEEPSQEATYEWVLSRWDDSANTPLDKVTAVIGQPIQYRAQVIETRPDGTKSPVSTEQMDLQWDYTYVTTDIDITVTTYSTGYIFTITGNKPLERPDGLILYTENVGPDPCVEACFDFEVVEPTEIESDTVYNISDKDGQDLYYRYRPTDAPDDGSYRSYTLWTDGGTAEATGFGIFAGEKRYNTYRRQGTDPINFQFSPTTDNARFELVESKQVTKIEFLSVPDSIIQDIRENGSKANLNGFTFKVTYADGSTRTYEYSGKKDDNYFVYHMDWTPDGNIYDCSYDSENNAISILGFKEPDAPTIEYYKIPDESKVNIKEGLSEVTGNLGNTEYNTVEKIENKLTETIVSNEGYTEDNTMLYDIELVTSEDGGRTWVPVTAENFPEEGIVVTLPYPEGTNADEYDFVVTHMFDEDVNGHHAGEVETPEVTESENGISFRLMGTSPVMIGYKKVAATHTHSYGEWTDCKDGSNHQRSCSCGDVQKEAHVWDDGKVTKEATKDAEGIKTYTCKTCGATKTVSIPKLTSDTTPSKPGDPTNPNTDTTSPETGDSANIALWIVVMLASAAGLSCTYFIKRKKVNN